MTPNSPPWRGTRRAGWLGGYMRFINFLFAVIFTLLLGCSTPNTNTMPDTTANKTMTIEDYLKITSELNNPNPEYNPTKVESVASKYGYTYQQYKDFYDGVQKDIKAKDSLKESIKR